MNTEKIRIGKLALVKSPKDFKMKKMTTLNRPAAKGASQMYFLLLGPTVFSMCFERGGKLFFSSSAGLFSIR